MLSLKAARAAPADAVRDPRIEQLPGRLDFENSKSVPKPQLKRASRAGTIGARAANDPLSRVRLEVLDGEAHR